MKQYSLQEYIDNNGWSSHKFIDHVKKASTLPWTSFAIYRDHIEASNDTGSYVFRMHYDGLPNTVVTMLQVQDNEEVPVHKYGLPITPDQLCESLKDWYF